MKKSSRRKDILHQYITLVQKIVRPKHFFGRKDEIKEISKFMESDIHRILTLRGIAGIGKTALMSKIVDYYTGKKNIFYWKLYPHSTLNGILLGFSGFLSTIGRNRAKNYVEKALGKINMEKIFAYLEKDLKKSNVLFIVDDYQNANEEIREFFSGFKDAIDATDVKVAIIGRSIPLFYDRRDVMVRKRIEEMSLGGLDKNSSKELLKKRGIDESYHERLYSITGGHPLMLELVKPGVTVEATDFIDKEIIAQLKDEERRALELASVFRSPFTSEAIIAGGITIETINALVGKSLLQRVDDSYEENDLIRGIFYTRMMADQKVEYHRLAGEYCLKIGKRSAILEAIYHLVKGYQQPEAAKLAIEMGEKIAEEYPKELLDALKSFEEKEIPEQWTELLLLRGDIYNQLGDHRKALESYNTCLEYTETARPRGEREHLAFLWFGAPRELMRTRARAYSKIGQAHLKLGEKEMAKKAFKNSTKIFEELGEQEEIEKIRKTLRG